MHHIQSERGGNKLILNGRAYTKKYGPRVMDGKIVFRCDYQVDNGPGIARTKCTGRVDADDMLGLNAADSHPHLAVCLPDPGREAKKVFRSRLKTAAAASPMSRGRHLYNNVTHALPAAMHAHVDNYEVVRRQLTRTQMTNGGQAQAEAGTFALYTVPPFLESTTPDGNGHVEQLYQAAVSVQGTILIFCSQRSLLELNQAQTVFGDGLFDIPKATQGKFIAHLHAIIDGQDQVIYEHLLQAAMDLMAGAGMGAWAVTAFRMYTFFTKINSSRRLIIVVIEEMQRRQ